MSFPSRPPQRPKAAAERLYVVFAYRVAADVRQPPRVRVLGTVRARDRRAAEDVAVPLAAARLAVRRAIAGARAEVTRGSRRAPRRDLDDEIEPGCYAVRWWTAGTCRGAWLLEALERDGAALRAVGHV